MEFCLDLETGTARNAFDLSPHRAVGDETLWGDVGLLSLSLLSNDDEARNSGIDTRLGWLWWFD